MNKSSDLFFWVVNSQQDRENLTGAGNNECDCDCDCACVTNTRWNLDHAQQIGEPSSLVLYPNRETRFFDLGDAFLALGPGHPPALLSAGCRELYAALPQSLIQAVDGWQNRWPRDQVKQVMLKMAQEGLLRAQTPGDAVAELAITQSDTLSAWVHLTDQCNLSCRYCYLDHQPADLSLSVGQGIVDAVFRSAIKHAYRRVILKYAGGEPVLNFNRLITLHRYATQVAETHQIVLEGRILSNGTLLTQPILEAIRANGLHLTISLDGLSAYHDQQRQAAGGQASFARVSAAIERCLALGIRPGISITITQASAQGLPELVGWLLDRDLHFTFNFYRASDQSQNQRDLPLQAAQELMDNLDKAFAVIRARTPSFSLLNTLTDRANFLSAHLWPCAAGRDYLVFDVQGNLAFCQMEMDHPLGHFSHADPLAFVRAQTRLKNPPVTEKPICMACEWRFWCAGGCPITARRQPDNPGEKSACCQIYQHIFPQILQLEGERLLHHYGIHA